MSQKEVKKKEVDVVTCPNKDQVTTRSFCRVSYPVMGGGAIFLLIFS
jgi:hypothetical protein